MITVEGLTKKYGDRVAVSDVSFTVRPGTVTGFLGPNGAGKSTTLRMLVGMTTPTSGRATIAGRDYAQLAQPLRTVGALLEVRSWHPARTVYDHLLWIAQTHRLPRHRIDAVIEMVGLESVARKRAGGFSLGMGQRLNIAAALLGDPAVLILDEPVNGLDPSGVRWMRDLMKELAAQGRTVLVSSHLMNEMAVTADHLLVIARGKLLADCTTQEFIHQNTVRTVLVGSREPGRLAELLVDEGGRIRRAGESLSVTGLTAEHIARIAHEARIVVHELSTHDGSLEEAFMDLVGDEVEYGGTLPGAAGHRPAELSRTPAAVAADRSAPTHGSLS